MMCSKIVFGVFCLVVCTAVGDSAALGKESNQIPIEGQKYDYFTLEKNYNKFIHSPVPCKVVVPTRDLIEENVKRVQPLGVILRRCPETLPTMEKWSCRSTNSVQVTVEVRIDRTGNGLKFHSIKTTEDLSCRCGPQQ